MCCTKILEKCVKSHKCMIVRLSWHIIVMADDYLMNASDNALFLDDIVFLSGWRTNQYACLMNRKRICLQRTLAYMWRRQYVNFRWTLCSWFCMWKGQSYDCMYNGMWNGQAFNYM